LNGRRRRKEESKATLSYLEKDFLSSKWETQRTEN
jgi:hypothetical protein